jgi:hypothetical protein
MSKKSEKKRFIGVAPPSKMSSSLEWHPSLELIFSELLDESQVRAYFHKKSNEYYSDKNIKYQLPIIILSAISGSGNFISSSFPGIQEYIILGVGALSIGTSIVSSIAQFLKLSQLSEGHRIAYISWEKFYSSIKLQIRRKQNDRDNIKDFLNSVIAEYQRLKEISPEIPSHIIALIKKNKKLLKDGNIKIPFIFDKFHHINAYSSSTETLNNMRESFDNIEAAENRAKDDIETSTASSLEDTESEPSPKQPVKIMSSIPPLKIPFKLPKQPKQPVNSNYNADSNANANANANTDSNTKLNTLAINTIETINNSNIKTVPNILTKPNYKPNYNPNMKQILETPQDTPTTLDDLEFDNNEELVNFGFHSIPPPPPPLPIPVSLSNSFNKLLQSPSLDLLNKPIDTHKIFKPISEILDNIQLPLPPLLQETIVSIPNELEPTSPSSPHHTPLPPSPPVEMIEHILSNFDNTISSALNESYM